VGSSSGLLDADSALQDPRAAVDSPSEPQVPYHSNEVADGLKRPTIELVPKFEILPYIQEFPILYLHTGAIRESALFCHTQSSIRGLSRTLFAKCYQVIWRLKSRFYGPRRYAVGQRASYSVGVLGAPLSIMFIVAELYSMSIGEALRNYLFDRITMRPAKADVELL